MRDDRMSAAGQTTPAQPVDLNSGVLAPVRDEVVATDLDVFGEIPLELNGILMRNGPNPFSGEFSGDGMLDWWGRFGNAARRRLRGRPGALVSQSLDSFGAVSTPLRAAGRDGPRR